jgi:hypothetical protein
MGPPSNRPDPKSLAVSARVTGEEGSTFTPLGVGGTAADPPRAGRAPANADDRVAVPLRYARKWLNAAMSALGGSCETRRRRWRSRWAIKSGRSWATRDAEATPRAGCLGYETPQLSTRSDVLPGAGCPGLDAGKLPASRTV